MNDIRLQGAEQLIKKLRELVPKVERKIIRQSLRAGAKEILAVTKDTAPRLTGTMADDLVVRSAKGGRGKTGVRVGFKNVETDLVRYGKSGKRYFYPAAVEFGHDGHPGSHFMGTSFDSAEPQAEETVLTTMAQGIETVAVEQ